MPDRPPEPVGRSDLVARFRDVLQRRGISADDPAPDVPDDDTRAWLRRVRAEKRAEVYERAVPERFRTAAYDQLHPVQQARGDVAGWLQSPSPTLLLAGPVGTGKTYAAYAVLADALARGLFVYGCTVLDLLNALRPDAAPSPAPRLAVQTDVFLFDDLAAERSTEWAVEQFGGIVDERTRERRRQVVTTNLGYADLETRLGQRVLSRLTGGATIARFSGPDRRQKW